MFTQRLYLTHSALDYCIFTKKYNSLNTSVLRLGLVQIKNVLSQKLKTNKQKHFTTVCPKKK